MCVIFADKKFFDVFERNVCLMYNFNIMRKLVKFFVLVMCIFAFVSCSRRTYHIKGSADKVEFEYEDELHSKTELR